MSKRGCQHRAILVHNARNIYIIECGTQVHRLMYYDTCCRCRAWLPLGPSDEAAVAVEVRAAEMADDVASDRSGDDLLEAYGEWSIPELAAFVDVVMHPWEQMHDSGVQAGCLAHAIVHHDEEQSESSTPVRDEQEVITERARRTR